MLDKIDRHILECLQENAEVSVVEIAEQVALSASACSRRIMRLKEEGYLTKVVALLDRKKANLPTTIFLIVRTGSHSETWLKQFHNAVSSIPEIVEVHRVTGNFDYILKIVLPNIEYYDVIYKRMLQHMELYDMSAYISMETVKQSFALPLGHL